jgi:hypothetical protein
MARLVGSVASDYKETVQWEKVVTNNLKGAERFMELSKQLGRPAPIPSIFINGELTFTVTPAGTELKEMLDQLIFGAG